MSESNTASGVTDPESTNPPQDPEWRARYDRVSEDQVAKFTDLYREGQDIYTKGRRGFMGPYTIHRALGNGQYKLRNGGEVMSKIYDEGDLYQNPNAGSAKGI